MTLEEKISADLKAAMMAKDAVAMRSLRAVKAAIMLAKTEKGATENISEEREIAILTKMIKQRKESIDIFEKQNREDLAATEKEEVSIIEKYMPAQMSEAEIRAGIEKIIAETGATTAKDMGKVMGASSKVFAGKADNKIVSEIVKTLLGA